MPEPKLKRNLSASTSLLLHILRLLAMATNNSSISGAVPQLPNPFTPMAFLPPEAAYRVTISNYICVGTMGVCDYQYRFALSFYSISLVIFQMMTWDILSNLRQDYALLFKFLMRAPTIVYFISRSVSVLAVVSTTL